MDAFTYRALPQSIIFGPGALAGAGDAVRSLGARRALVITTPAQAEAGARLLAQLGAEGAGLFSGAVMHTPVEVTAAALEMVREKGVDCAVALGGGSTIGLAKALALRTDMPQVAIPTTYAGSEMTPILGETDQGVKTTQRTLKVLPEVVLYDVDLTLALPVNLSVASGMNAIAHAAEALYAKDRNPIISLLSEEAVRRLAAALPRLVADPRDPAARTDALYGAALCGMALGSVGMALHHKLCHTLGGSFDLPHAETHAAVLPHALAYTLPAAPEARAALARALGSGDPALALYDLEGRLGAPRALKRLGMPQDGIARAAALAMTDAYWNPRPLQQAAIEALIARAWRGDPPETDEITSERREP